MLWIREFGFRSILKTHEEDGLTEFRMCQCCVIYTYFLKLAAIVVILNSCC